MRTVRVILSVAAAGLLVTGVVLFLSTRAGTTGPALLWLVCAVLLHDLLLAPLVLLCGLALRGSALRGVWRGALITAGCLTLVALPTMLYAGPPDNPSVLPLDYPRNWLLAMAGTALAVLLVLLPRALRRLAGLRRQTKDRS